MKNKESNAKIFENGFKKLCYTRSPYTVWENLMEMFATCLQNGCTRYYLETGNEILINTWNKREKRYNDLASKYSNEEIKLMAEMFAALTLELSENPYQDFLGKMYMNLEISNSDAGQFFTPFDVSKMCAEITADHKTLRDAVKEKGFASVCDPSVGAGGMLIAGAYKCSKEFHRLDYKNHVYFVGQDLDITCVHMCYIQLSLTGHAGYVLHGNTLTKPDFDYFKDNENIWTTPYYNSNIWQMRILFHGFGPLMEERKNKNGK